MPQQYKPAKEKSPWHSTIEVLPAQKRAICSECGRKRQMKDLVIVSTRTIYSNGRIVSVYECASDKERCKRKAAGQNVSHPNSRFKY